MAPFLSQLLKIFVLAAPAAMFAEGNQATGRTSGMLPAKEANQSRAELFLFEPDHRGHRGRHMRLAMRRRGA
jgi:hypothetical protein